MSIAIKKAKLRNGFNLEVEYTESTGDGYDTVKKECTAEAHSDLKDAFTRLDIHVCLLAEQLNKETLYDHYTRPVEAERYDILKKIVIDDFNKLIIPKISCTGYSIGGHDEHEGVTLIGRRELSNKKIINIITPFQKWNDEFSPYMHGSELYNLVQACNNEVELYLFEGKCTPAPQMELEFNE